MPSARKVKKHPAIDGPTVYVFDAKGVIRAKNVREKEMDKVVDELLKVGKE